jgi:hypothetical protein
MRSVWMRSAWSKGFRCGWQLGIVATKLDVVLRLSVKAPTSSVLLTNNSNVMIMLSLIPVRCAARLANISLCTASSFALSLSLFLFVTRTCDLFSTALAVLL